MSYQKYKSSANDQKFLDKQMNYFYELDQCLLPSNTHRHFVKIKSSDHQDKINSQI